MAMLVYQRVIRPAIMALAINHWGVNLGPSACTGSSLNNSLVGPWGWETSNSSHLKNDVGNPGFSWGPL